MAVTHPYTSSGGGVVVQVVQQLRRQFPASVNLETLKRLGIGAGTEQKLVNLLKFVGVLDSDGKRTSAAGSVFAQHDDAQFAKGFEELVKAGYSDLFGLHGDAAWTLPAARLISFFRSADQTSALVGQRQTTAFQALAGLCGHGEAPAATASRSKAASGGKPMVDVRAKPVAKVASPKPVAPTEASPALMPEPATAKKLPSIHIDVQVHISPETSAEQIDRIFASMAKHL